MERMGLLMNYIPKICEMLGLEWDEENQESEEFDIQTKTLTIKALKIKDGEVQLVAHENGVSTDWLKSILTGAVKIMRKPWKPKVGDGYFCTDINNENFYSKTGWTNNSYDNRQYERGLAFKTEEEAVAKAKEILEMLKGGK